MNNQRLSNTVNQLIVGRSTTTIEHSTALAIAIAEMLPLPASGDVDIDIHFNKFVRDEMDSMIDYVSDAVPLSISMVQSTVLAVYRYRAAVAFSTVSVSPQGHGTNNEWLFGMDSILSSAVLAAIRSEITINVYTKYKVILDSRQGGS